LSDHFDRLKALAASDAHVGAAIQAFRATSKDTRQALSDWAWQQLLEVREEHPEITIDQIMATHARLIELYDDPAQAFKAAAEGFETGRRSLYDILLDDANESRRRED